MVDKVDRIEPEPSARWLTAAEAARELGVQQRSLYAYVSRGLVRSVPAAAGKQRLYAAADLERLRARRDARAGHGAVAAGALQFGEAVLDSAITELSVDGPVYRGLSAAELVAAEVPFENVAELLWSGALCPEPVRWPVPPVTALPRVTSPAVSVTDALAELALHVGRRDPERADGRADAMSRVGRALIPVLAAGSNPRASAAQRAKAARQVTVAGRLAAAWGMPTRAVDAVDRALVLLADHELNASTFAARVAASTGADPYAVVGAGLAALSGPRHGSAVLEVAGLLDQVSSPARAGAVLRALRAAGRVPPGFGHRAYSREDPRVPPLLGLATVAARDSRGAARALRRCRAVLDAACGGEVWPNVDFALATLAAVLDAPIRVATAWYAVGRCAGWLAHACEQRATGVLLRPRARYIGPPRRSVHEVLARRG